MRVSTPRGWYRRPAAPARSGGVGEVASTLWSVVTARRIARGKRLDVGVPVVCVGNLTLGGSGKTPIVRELARRLISRGVDAQILMRGHGGRIAGPLRVDADHHTAADVGDEALMMAADAPVWVSRNRAVGAKAAAEAGARIIVMDDGHQNASVKKALSLIVVDGETRGDEWPFGDGRVFPAGPMREPFEVGLGRADVAVVLMPADLAAPDPKLLDLFRGKPVLVARLSPVDAPPSGPQIAFAGIGKPWKMQRALKAAGCDLRAFMPLPDHARLSDLRLASLARQADTLGAGLVTSEKDWVRLTPGWRARIVRWPVRAIFEDEAALDRLLESVL